MNISSKNFTSIEQVTGQYLNGYRKNPLGERDREVSFGDILAGKLKFSKHAVERLESREINLSDTQLKRLETGMDKAREKGIDESLVLVDELAFIVSTKSNTVITAVDDKEDKIFTNIEGAVII